MARDTCQAAEPSRQGPSTGVGGFIPYIMAGGGGGRGWSPFKKDERWTHSPYNYVLTVASLCDTLHPWGRTHLLSYMGRTGELD